MTALASQPNILLPSAAAELVGFEQWVVSKLVERRKPKTGEISYDKPPMYLRNGRLAYASHSNPEHWTSYAAAQAIVERGIGGAQAVGFVFHDSDPYTGIDFDGCRDPQTGIIEPWAQIWIDRLASYTEISQSGTGCKTWVRGTLPTALIHKLGAHKGIEVYSCARFFWMTFNRLPGTPDCISDGQAVLDQMVCELAPTPKPAPACSRAAGERGGKQLARERCAGESLMERLHRELDLDAILERNGYTLVAVRGDMHDFSAPACEGHTHRITITTEPSTKHAGRIGHSKSPSGALGNAAYPNGFDALNALETLEGKTWRDLVPEHSSTSTSKRQAPEYLTEAATQRRAAERSRKQAARCSEAATIRADVEARAATDARLTPADHATLGAMLDWAEEHNVSCCWCGRAALACRAGYSLGSVKRAVIHLESLDYFESTGKGGDSFATAKRTFTRGSCRAEALVHGESSGTPDRLRDTDVRTSTRGSCATRALDDGESSGASDTVVRTTTRGSSERTSTRGSYLTAQTIFCAKDDPRLYNIRDLTTESVLASEGGASSHAHAHAGDPADAWELFAPAGDDGHGAAELSALERDTRERGRQPADQAAPLTSPASQTTARRAGGAAGERAVAPAALAQRTQRQRGQLRAVLVLEPDADEPALLTSPSSLAAEPAQREQSQLDQIRALLGIEQVSEQARLEQIRAILGIEPAAETGEPVQQPADEQPPAHQPEPPELSDHALIVQDYYASGSDIPIADALAWLTTAQISAAIDELQRATGIASALATPSHRDLLTAVRSCAREVNEPGWMQRDYDDYDRNALQQELERLDQLLAAGRVTPASASEPTRPQLLQQQADLPPGRVIQSGPRWCAWRGDNATWHVTEAEARFVAGLDVPASGELGSRPTDEQQRPAHQPEQPELSDHALIVQDYFASASNAPIADALGWLTAAEIAAAVEELRRYHHEAQPAPATEALRWQALPPEALATSHWRKPGLCDDDQPDGASYETVADWTAHAGPAVERHYERSITPREAYTKAHGWRDIWANMQRRDTTAADEPATEPLDWSETEAETLVLAPPLETSPTYRDFAWRWNAAQQSSRSPAQRAKFKRDATVLLEAVSATESVRRWELFKRRSPKARVYSVAEVISPAQSTPSTSPVIPPADQAPNTQQAGFWGQS